MAHRAITAEAAGLLVECEESYRLTSRATDGLAAASVMLEEFLVSLPDYHSGGLERRDIVHGHCHLKLLVGMEPTPSKTPKGLSQACGERVVFPVVRGTAADDLVVTPASSAGTRRSCWRWRLKGTGWCAHHFTHSCCAHVPM